MRSRRLGIIPILLATFFLFAYRGEGGDKEEQVNIKSVVSLYTTILAEGYARLNMSPLLQVATGKRASKAYHHMASLGEARSKMLANLERISFSPEVVISPEKAAIDTAEDWLYTFVNIDSGQETFTNRIRYQLTYHLLKEEGRWLVDDITIREEVEEKNSQEKVPFLQRP